MLGRGLELTGLLVSSFALRDLYTCGSCGRSGKKNHVSRDRKIDLRRGDV
jgi:hypothetical protein